MQIRGGRASETCTPTQEEMGLRFDLKPPSWCLVQFLKWQLTFQGETLEKITAKISGLEIKQGIRGDGGVLSI